MFFSISVSAQVSYYMEKAQSYMRDAEYYTKKAEGYDREAEYYSKKAQGTCVRQSIILVIRS